MASEFCVQTESNKKNIRLGVTHTKPDPPPWQHRKLVVKLSQDEAGAWGTSINKGRRLPATDVEVNLWKELQEWKQLAQHWKRLCESGLAK